MSEFLTLDEVLAIHADQLHEHGGSDGIRDLGLLESALSMPRAGFGGTLLHETLMEQAAAYLFHIARNHPFVDGNKRTALDTALTFLWMNGCVIDATVDEVVELTEGVAAGSVTKAAAAVWFEKHRASR